MEFGTSTYALKNCIYEQIEYSKKLYSKIMKKQFP